LCSSCPFICFKCLYVQVIFLLQLHMQSVLITTDVVTSNIDQGEVCNII
jgi:hypothetical protein